MLGKSFPMIFILSASMMPLSTLAACKEKLAEVDRRIADSELDVNLRTAVQQFRDHAAAMCQQGNDATAVQTLSYVEMMLPPTQAQVQAEQQVQAEKRSRLTPEFLAGNWCSMTGEERSQLVFAPDGTSKACIHDSAYGAYGKCFDYKSIAEWVDGYKGVQSVEQDEIALGKPNDFSVFKRGECSRYGR